MIVGVAAGLSPWAGAGALAAAIFGVVVIHRPDVGALALVAIAPAVSGLDRGFPVPGFRLSEVLIAGAATLILVTADRRQGVRWRAFDWLALAYVIATAVLGSAGLISRGAGFSWDSIGKLTGPLQFFLAYRAVVVALATPEDRRRALGAVLIASIPVSILALLQQFDLAGVRDLMTTVTGTDIYGLQAQTGDVSRATGPFPHWHQLGGYLLLVTLIGIGLLLAGSGRVLQRSWLLAIVALSVVALVQTVTIAAVFGALGGSLLIGNWLHRLRSVLRGVVAVAAGVALIAGPVIVQRFEQQWVKPPGSETSAFVPNTLDYRWDVWTEEYFPALEGRWLTGYGPDPVPGTRFVFTESLYIELIVRGGLILLAIYAAMTVALWAMARGAMRDPDPDRRIAAAVVAAAVLLLLFIHVIQPYFVDSGPPHLLWALSGLLAGAGAASTARRARSWRGAATPQGG